MGAVKEIGEIGKGLRGIGEGMASLFDPAQRAARADIAAAQKAARADIIAAQGKVAAAQAEAAVKAIEANAKKAADAAAKGPGFAARAGAKVSGLGSGAVNGAKALGAGAVRGIVWTVTRPIVWPAKVIGWGAAQPLKASASLGVSTVDAVAGVALKPVKWLANGAGSAFSSRPGVSLFVTAGAAAVAAGSWFASRGSKDLQAQSDAIQQIQMAQMQAQSAQPRYMNNPEASQAFVDARMAADRDNGVAGASNSRADAVMAARQQAPTATADVSAI